MKLPLLFLCMGFVLAGCGVHRSDDGFGDGLIGQENEPSVPGQSTGGAQGAVGTARAGESQVPWENRRETSQPPLPDEDTEDRVREMFSELAGGNARGVSRWMIPLELLRRIKDMHMASPEENDRAVQAMHAELSRKSENRARRFLARGRMAQASFESLELGQCRFVPAGRDFNRLAFWLCEKNRIYYHVEGERKSLDVRRLVNWGRTWYLLEW